MPGFRKALIETAVCLNAAQAAFSLRQDIETASRWEIEVLYGVYNLTNHQVSMPIDPQAPPSDANVRLAQAPANPREFQALARQMAEILKDQSATDAGPGVEPGSIDRDGGATSGATISG
jgi:carbonic anhydrase